MPLVLPPTTVAVILDNGSVRPSSVCLPYSLVPGMDIASVAYDKAVSTIAKQINANAHNLCLDSHLSSSSAHTDLGTSPFSQLSCLLLQLLSFQIKSLPVFPTPISILSGVLKPSFPTPP